MSALNPAQAERDAAYHAGRQAAEEGVPLHDLTGHMDRIGIEQHLRGSWLSGVESFYEDQGVDTDPDSDGYGWERRALAGTA